MRTNYEHNWSILSQLQNKWLTFATNYDSMESNNERGKHYE